jgi:ketosteroid isomerase-like protein
MSQENVEIVRRTYAAFNRGDVAAVLGFFDPDIEFNVADVFLDKPRTYRGHRAWREGFLRDLMEVFEEFRAEPEELIDAGDNVAAVVQAGGPGRRSGARAIRRVAHVFTLRDGRIVRFTEFKEVDKALEAAGLSE